MPRVLVSNAQYQTKNCYAPAPKLNLTLITNGEEKVSVIDSLGNIIRAGFDAPTIAPTVAVGAGAAAWEPDGTDTYWQYRYVYVAKNAYPLVENAVTGGGSLSPRSNPSPSGLANSTVSPTVARRISIPTSTRSDITHIWLYRTELHGTADEAQTYADAGVMFWIGEVANNPNLATVNFTDNVIPGLEQIEFDNYVAPQAKYCVYADPYFYMIGNDYYLAEVTITSTGLVTATDPENRWYDGRDSQIAFFDGITRGGFDNHGNFYVKILSPTTIQLYQDIALTQMVGVPNSGTTRIHIKGLSTTLFRSKPRNPFSWGVTDLVNDAQVPAPYLFSLGGGRATALIALPNLNLLKIDVENPTACYTLNLKNAGTPNFEPSLRPIASSYVSSSNFTQFPATVEKGRSVVWGLDTRSFAIIQCDGSSQQPVSDNVCETMRNLSLGQSEQQFFHGTYHPRLELNCMFLRTEGAAGSINRCIYNHWPTGQWGMIDVMDILCSAQILDPVTGELKLIVGNTEGWIGEFGAEGVWNNWIDNGIGIFNPVFAGVNVYKILVGGGAFDVMGPRVVGNWMLIWDTYLTPEELATNPSPEQIATIAKYTNFRYAKIYKVIPDDPFNPFLVEIKFAPDGALFTPFYDRDFKLIQQPIQHPFSTTAVQYLHTHFWVGPIELLVARWLHAEVPFEAKKLDEMWASFRYYTDEVPTEPSTVSFGINYDWIFETMIQPDNGDIIEGSQLHYTFAKQQLSTPAKHPQLAFKAGGILPIDQASVLGIMMSDRNPVQVELVNYELRLVNVDGNNR